MLHALPKFHLASLAGLAGLGLPALSLPAGGATAPTQAVTIATVTGAARYIVRLRQPAAADTAQVAAHHGVAVGRTFAKVLDGFTGTMSARAAQALRQHPLVHSVEPDLPVALDAARAQAPATLQATAPWGLDRIDQRALLQGRRT